MLGALTLVVWRVATTHGAAPVRYETSRVDQGPLAAKVTATGTLSALVTVTVGSQVSGRIDTLGADFESQVHKGQVIATIEPSLLHAAAAQARANYFAAIAAVNKTESNEKLAIEQVARAEALNKEGLLSRADLDTSRATRASAHADVDAAGSNVGQFKAALNQAELNLKYTVIVSPIDGVVISRNVDIGQTVAATFQAPTLFIIAQDLTRMQVDTNVAEADVGKVRAAMPVTFTVDAYPDRKFGGTVRQVRDNAQTIAERRHLRRGHRRRQHRAPAQTRHDRERDLRLRAEERRHPRAGKRALASSPSPPLSRSWGGRHPYRSSPTSDARLALARRQGGARGGRHGRHQRRPAGGGGERRPVVTEATRSSSRPPRSG